MLSNSEYLKPGTTLKRRYQILKLIGEGSFGHTYLAEDTYETNSQGIVVIKKLKSHTNHQILEVAKKKFISEAFSLRKLGYKHEQIPTLLDFFYIEDQFFLVQEYIEGISLSTRLNLSSSFQQKIIFNEGEAIHLLTQLLNILKCVHENQTIHLDIKPLNIIWRKKDNKYFLIDFGCVQDISSYVLLDEQVAPSAILGTPHYMPLEQSAGNPHYNSDIYALGIVVIQTITGLKCIDFRYNRKGKLIWQNKANITESFKKILNKMIQVDYRKNHRYQTVDEVLEDLKDLRYRNPIRIISKFLFSNRKLFFNSYLNFLVLTLGLTSVLWISWKIWLKPRIWETSDQISIGEQIYFHTDKDCTNQVQHKQYLAAKKCFEQLMFQDTNNPELRIYYNNNLALSQSKQPLYLAVVAPLSNNSKIAQEILRGIAHSQHLFNQNGGINGRFLVIAIANDGNQPDKAKKIAQLLKEENLISGVIGHNSSQATSAGIKEYRTNNIPFLSPTMPLISPTSTRNSLQQEDIKNQFFRIAISDEIATQVLAKYITKIARTQKIAVFYEPNKNKPKINQSSLIKNLKKIKLISFTDVNFNRLNLYNFNSIRNTQEAKQTIQDLLANDIEYLALFPDFNSLDSLKYISIALNDIPEAKKFKIYGVTFMDEYDVVYNPILNNIVGLKGTILTPDWAREIPQAQLFLEQFQDQWGIKTSLISGITANSYDATQVFIQAFKNQHYTRTNILNYLNQNFYLDAAYTSGQDITFDSAGNRVGKSVLVELDLDNSKSLNLEE